ncbi:MAG: LacI family DNA-binding transcriptional regulator [Anaerolineae bacterium]|nr:LacI family DNA-binding transcriptional regulator [Anaerolineae bacterium]
MSDFRSKQFKRPTMYDVARLAGVSQPTVSRVLSAGNAGDASALISDETTQRVLDAVNKLGYRPNVVARSLRTRRTFTVAMLIADLSNGFYHPMARAVQDVARQHNYEVLISNSDHIYENERHFCDIVLGSGVDGVLMVPIHLSSDELSQYVDRAHIPFVALAEHIKHPHIDLVWVNDHRATYEGTRWLINKGSHQKVGFIGVSDDLPPGPRRFDGFTRAMNDAGLQVDPRFIKIGDFTLESGKKAARSLIEGGELPTAIFAINDLMAIGLILTLQDAGYRVPEDVAVIGFDDIPEASIVRPALTTLAQNPRDIGEKMAEMLFERIENPNSTERRVYESHCHLIVRDSA